MRFLIKVFIEAVVYFIATALATATGAALYAAGCDGVNAIIRVFKKRVDNALNEESED